MSNQFYEAALQNSRECERYIARIYMILNFDGSSATYEQVKKACLQVATNYPTPARETLPVLSRHLVDCVETELVKNFQSKLTTIMEKS